MRGKSASRRQKAVLEKKVALTIYVERVGSSKVCSCDEANDAKKFEAVFGALLFC